MDFVETEPLAKAAAPPSETTSFAARPASE